GVAEVYAVVIGVLDRRAGDAHVDLLRAGLVQHLRDLAGGAAAHDAVVNQHDALALDGLPERAVLHAHAAVAHALHRLDEGARHVAVLHEALAHRDAARRREALGCGTAALRHADHHVGLDRRFLEQVLAHPEAHLVDLTASEQAVRPCEVEVLEDALLAR